jgi:hypothetical protein
MKRFGKIARKIRVQHVGKGAVFALALLALPALFAQVSRTSDLQVENSSWQAYAERYVQTPAVAVKTDLAVTKPFELASLQTFTAAHIDRAMVEKKQLDCLTTAIYYEARSEPVAGQLAVAQVVLNRTTSKHYPSSICEVVYQGAERKTGCQFSFTCDGSLLRLPRDVAWERSRKSAVHAILGMSDVTIGRATHYHTVAISPKWSNTLLRTANVGSHVFYRFPNRREKAAMAKEI